MNKVIQIGKVSWTEEEVKAEIPSFIKLYNERPLKDNIGGMKSPHMFATWFMLKKLKPSCVIESGVWKGQSTWLIEQTLPDAKIYSLDIKLRHRKYISEKAIYINKDFTKNDWSHITDKENTLLFFDDHQNGFKRIVDAKKMGFKKFIFEDNYSGNKGDCYSLKKAFEGVGFKPKAYFGRLKFMIYQFYIYLKTKPIPPNKEDAEYLKKHLKTYYEFPPIMKSKMTRWGDEWSDKNYPTKPPFYDKLENSFLEVFEKEATDYTWICYAQLI